LSEVKKRTIEIRAISFKSLTLTKNCALYQAQDRHLANVSGQQIWWH